MSNINKICKYLGSTLCLLLTACSNSGNKTDNDSIVMVPCEDITILKCGSFEVPLIHDSTDNRQISIGVAILPGTGDGPHEPLVVNFGGPGSGIEILQEIAMYNLIPASVRKHYDIVGFDQRGVGNPLRINCDHLGNVDSLLYPRGYADVQTLVDDSTQLANACSAQYTDSLQYVGSNSVVQDMEIMRNRLDAEKLNILGVSFGTRISMLYLERYPETTGRVVLDAPLRPNGKINSLLLETTDAQQVSFEQILNVCGSTLPDCERVDVEAAFVARVNSLLDNEDYDTFRAFIDLMFLAVEESDIGEILAPMLIDYAFYGDPEQVFAVLEQFGIEENEEEESDTGNSSITLERAVLCADDSFRPNTEQLINTLSDLNASSDFFAETMLPLAASCVGWPEAVDPLTEIRTTDAPASLVIGGSLDVNTPISWAIETAEAIDGVFLSSDHWGHTIVYTRDNQCVDSIVSDYLIEGILPPGGAVCNKFRFR